MAATEYADSRAFFGTSVPKVWRVPARHSLFGNIALVAFLLAQCFDGIFTYVGVITFGTGIEANPVICALMVHLGHVVALMTAKTLSASLGIALHLWKVHGAVALLAIFYVTVAILPWIDLLFF
jgi:hypothetical protein